jgi:hypothetical protein
MLFEFEDERNISNLYNIDEGFTKGNMFKDLYDPYKDYEVKKIIPTTQHDLLLYNLHKYSFAINDLNLYLDLNPNDVSMIKLFNDYRSRYVELLREYENKYGPINTANIHNHLYIVCAFFELLVK